MGRLSYKTRREIERLSASLPALTERQKAEAQKCDGHAWLGKRIGWCDCCGEEFEHELWNSKKKTMRCPVCGAKVQIKKSAQKRVYCTQYYFETVHIADGWQVVRVYHVRRDAKRRVMFGNEELHPSELKMEIKPVYDRFIREREVPIIIGLGVWGTSYYCDLWRWDSEWKIRREDSQHFIGGWVASRPQLLPVLKQRGLRKLNDNCSAWRQISSVLSEYEAEVLLKAGAVKLYERYINNRRSVVEYWESVRVALRHKYDIADVGMWLDLLYLLDRNGKDIRNPHFICPDDLKKAHDEQLALRRRIEAKERKRREEAERRRLAEQLSDDGEMNVAYMARLGKVLGVVVKVGNLELKPLQSVREFYEEGEMLHHCVFANKYYKRENCLIIGARIEGERTETIEVNTENWKIVQCRGTHNQPSKWHDLILETVQNNMGKFRKAFVG